MTWQQFSDSITRFVHGTGVRNSIWLPAAICAGEVVLLAYGQRRVYGHIASASRSRFLTYVIVAPGTVLHEFGHFAMCKILFVEVYKSVWFWPQRLPDGSRVLGYVQHRGVGPIRSTLIAIAPVLVVPPILAGICVLALGTNVLSDPLTAVANGGIVGNLLAFGTITFGSRSAFPSRGDHPRAAGSAILLLVAAAVTAAAYRYGSLREVLASLAVILAFPSAGILAMRLLVVPFVDRKRSHKTRWGR